MSETRIYTVEFTSGGGRQIEVAATTQLEAIQKAMGHRTWLRDADLYHLTPDDKEEYLDYKGWAQLDIRVSPPQPLYEVHWDNGHASGVFSERFLREEEAEAYGKDWLTEMVGLDPRPSEAVHEYDYEVLEVQE